MVVITAYVCRYCDGEINAPITATVTIVGSRKCKICGNPIIRISNEFNDRAVEV